jgi:hypothetical protein
MDQPHSGSTAPALAVLDNTLVMAYVANNSTEVVRQF